MDVGDRHLHLLHLRKTFSGYLKDSHERDASQFERLLPLFNKVLPLAQTRCILRMPQVMHLYTPDEVAAQFKEMPAFCGQMSELLVQEIRKRATKTNTVEAAESIHSFLRANPPDARGWTMVKAVAFMVNW